MTLRTINMTQVKQILLLDLVPQCEPIKDQILKVIEEILDSKKFINGPKIENFKKELAVYCGSKYSIGMNSGSNTLIVALITITYLMHKEGNFKEKKRSTKEVISIPIYDRFKKKQLKKTCHTINALQ